MLHSAKVHAEQPILRRAQLSDLEALLQLESACFSSDRLSRRSFKRWIRNTACVFLVCEEDSRLIGYVLVLFYRGTSLARLYSVAVHPDAQGRGIAARLIGEAEKLARNDGRLHMRLEVASYNSAAIRLYEKLGYQQFGLYHDYYEDHADALRMQKCIHAFSPDQSSRQVPWLAQTTSFTCGPTALMMAMTGLDEGYQPSPTEELQIWREATTIFMTSGLGGCHPMGLALAAHNRGFEPEVWINQQGPLFVESVRDENKKRVIELVHEEFCRVLAEREIVVHYADINQEELVNAFNEGAMVLVLISTYRLDQKKAPHWVVLSGFDEHCLYVHDPDIEDDNKQQKNALDCQYIPIARDQFVGMSQFGSNRLRTAVIIRRRAAAGKK